LPIRALTWPCYCFTAASPDTCYQYQHHVSLQASAEKQRFGTAQEKIELCVIKELSLCSDVAPTNSSRYDDTGHMIFFSKAYLPEQITGNETARFFKKLPVRIKKSEISTIGRKQRWL